MLQCVCISSAPRVLHFSGHGYLSQLQKTEEIRDLLKLKVSRNEAKDSTVHLAFRFPDGRKLNYFFEGQDTTMVCCL